MINKGINEKFGSLLLSFTRTNVVAQAATMINVATVLAGICIS